MAVFGATGIQAQKQTDIKGIFSISPAILNISLSPGKTHIYDVRVSNLTKGPLPVRAEIERVLENEYSGGVNSIAEWTKIDQSDMIIPANSTKTIKLTVKTPDKIPLGGYYGTLFLQPVMPGVKGGAAGPLIQGRAGLIILANIGVPDLSARAEIQNVSIEKTSPKERHVSFDVRNMSLYHFSAKAVMAVKPLVGAPQKIPLDEKIILPGKTRKWEQTVEWPFRMLNVYDVRILVSVGNGEQIVYRTKYADIPYKTVTVIALFGVVIIVAYNKRKRLRKALRILFLNK